MYPGPDDPDLGIFVANLERELAARGHELERAVVDRRAGGKLRHLGLALDARRAARRFRPDVVYAHFLAPAGLIAALASRALHSSSPPTDRTWRTRARNLLCARRRGTWFVAPLR